MGDYSKNLKKRVQHIGNDRGLCVICGEYGKLSRDHVPPKRCNNLNDVELRTLFPSDDWSKKGQISQGGSFYKTLCSTCNNTRLGKYYDPFLVNLSNEITSLVLGAKNRKIVLPSSIFTFIRPQRIARAIVGHCLAANSINETRDGLTSSPMNDILREYFLNIDAAFPEKLNIYFWPYPSRRQVIIKGMGKASLKSKPIIGNVIKFLPLGFWIVWDKPNNVRISLPELVKDKSLNIDDVLQFEIDIHNIPRIDFPETPSTDEFILMNDNFSLEAIPSRRLK